jgi:hypothetical protein
MLWTKALIWEVGLRHLIVSQCTVQTNKNVADAYDVTRLFQFGLPSVSLYSLWSLFSVPLYGGDVFARSSLHCLSLVQLPYLFCVFPVSRCQDLVLFAVCLLGVFVPSPFCNVLFRFSLSLWTLALKTKWKYFYCLVLSLTDVRKRTAFWKVPRLRPFVLLVRAISRWIWSSGGMKLTRQNRITGRKTCCDVTFSATNMTWTELKLNPSLRGERLENSRLGLGTAETDVCLN